MKKSRHAERPVQPVLRALGLIEALNRKPVSALEDLAGATGLPKPTVVRLMQTLIAGGYAERLPRRRGYAPAERVRRLSEGFRDADAVVAAARPLLSAFTAEHQWPVILATFDHGAMRIRLSTRQESPFATDDDQTAGACRC
jgi:IclR family transcriptional regulator, mhp operon transcriptional activator